MGVESPVKQHSPSLRWRTHILERAPSDISSPKHISLESTMKSIPEMLPELSKPMQHVETAQSHSSLTEEAEYSDSESSDDIEFAAEEARERPRAQPPSRQSSPAHVPSPPQMRRTISEVRTSRAWYEFDLAVVAALVSPVGNWLTGGDHVKNLIFVVLLIFYLHQVIEIPWSLYQSARPHKRSPHVAAPHSQDDRHLHLATSELRSLEIFFLTLTVLSPFIGAVLLRYVTGAVTGDNAISWFSTGLFVLATGIRPWTHVVERLSQRVTELHDVIHYPSGESSTEEIQKEMESMMHKMEVLEKSMAKMKQKMASGKEQVFEYVDDAVDAVENAVKRHERKCEKHEARVRDVEVAVESIKGKKKEKPSPVIFVDTTAAPSYSLLSYILPGWLVNSPQPKMHKQRLSPSSAGSKYSMYSFSGPSERLETIPEEHAGAPPPTPPPPQHNFVTRLFLRTTYIAIFPLRSFFGLIRAS